MKYIDKTLYSNNGADYLKLTFIDDFPFISDDIQPTDFANALYKRDSYDWEKQMWKYHLVERKSK